MRSKLTPIYNEEKEVEKEDKKQYSVPHYTKINGWDQANAEVKQLGKLLTNRKERGGSEVQVLEGVRLIRDAIKLGFTPSVIVFSRVKLLWQLGLPTALPGCRLYHLPYSSIRLWTDLSTSPGVMAALPKDQLEGVTARSPLPLTLLCDGVRHPDNLGSLVRLGAAVGARRVLCIGCTDAWGSKAVRAGAGAHLLVPVVQGVTWQEVRGLLDDPWAQVVITDLPREAEETEEPEEEQVVQLTEAETARRVAALEARLVEEGEGEEPGAALLEEFRQLPVPSSDYTRFQLEAGRREVVVVVGGETEGVSGAAYRLCHQLGGSRLHVPLRNSVNSLNVASAASVLLFRVQEALLEQEASRATESTSQ
jgi:tRNA G18 (ribose-2'-O)-methylase SpoU